MKISVFALLSLILLLTGAAFADATLLAHFFPQSEPVKRYVARPVGELPEVDFGDPSVDQYNSGVELNNQALEAMRANDFVRAGNLFARACQLVPSEKGFWSNRLIALRRIKGREEEAIKVARTVMAINENDFQAPYIVGLIYLNELKNPEQALPYLDHAFKVSPEDTSVAMALATAFEQAGYDDDAFELLKKYAHKATNDPYPFYLLGLQYLERKDYNPAIRSFNTARATDQKGYVHDAWIRARYFAGQLEGLESDCRAVLQRFPDVLNRLSLERILASLRPGDYRFVESIGIKISQPSALDKLDFLIKPVVDIADHQFADLVKAEFISRGTVYKANVDAKEGLRLRIGANKEILSPEFTLRLTYRIKTMAMLGSCMPASNAQIPDLKILCGDPLMSLEHPVLSALADKISKMPGNYVQNAAIAVANGLRYKENFEDFSVEWALANPDNCDCTEFARLMAALCLKHGIPARIATGFLVKAELMNKETAVGHAWCEVFFKGKGWVPIDVTLQTNMQWAYFGNLLSDQILFDYIGVEKRSRVSIDFTSTRPDLKVNLSNSYHISNW
ncbi:MAG: tetratricopeptide repeat protein [Erysipelotrichia bacterium]|nr:tetratricopeptide repeat protein [Erysipelotrichia bacterium]